MKKKRGSSQFQRRVTAATSRNSLVDFCSERSAYLRKDLMRPVLDFTLSEELKFETWMMSDKAFTYPTHHVRKKRCSCGHDNPEFATQCNACNVNISNLFFRPKD